MSSGNASTWSEAASGWERQRDHIAALGAPVTERLIELADPRPDETVLELACGNGEVGLALAALLTGGRLIQSDLAPEMVAAAGREAARLGHTTAEHRLLDMERLDLPDNAVDAIVCRWGYMLVDHPVRALSESRRVLRPGGRVALAVWAEAAHNPWATATGRALLELGLMEPPDPDAPGPFRLGDLELLDRVIRDAGLEPVQHEEVAVTWSAPSFEAFWEITRDLSNALRSVYGQLDGTTRIALERRVEELLEPYVVGTALVIPGLTRLVLAREAA